MVVRGGRWSVGLWRYETSPKDHSLILKSHQFNAVTEPRPSHFLDVQTPSKLTLLVESSKVGFQDPLRVGCHMRADGSILDFVAVFDRLADAASQLIGFFFDR
jgi:hypothetical protein